MSMQFKKTGLMLAVAFFLFGVGVERVDAGEKSVTWTSGTVPDLAYYWNNGGAVIGGGWMYGLKQATVHVTYKAQVKNMTQSSKVLTEGDSVQVGDRLRFEAIPFNDSDISWAGTGYSTDTPYGHWLANAAAPAMACNPGDYVGDMLIYRVYVPLSVNTPSISYDTTGSTAGLSCSGQECTVTSAGQVKANIIFSDTFGKFYYRYLVTWTGVCYANNIAMRVGSGETPLREVVSIAGSDYILSVPSQTVTFNLTASGTANQPPTIPTISGPTTGVAGVAYDYSIVATDPDANSKMFFDLDFSNVNASTNGTVDTNTPSGSGVVDSGVSAPFSRTFSSPGTYKMSGRAISFTSGNVAATRMVGAWSPEYTVTISAAVPGTCGSVNGTTLDSLSSTSAGLCGSGSVSGFTTNASTWTWSCNGNNGVNRSCSANILPGPTLTFTASPSSHVFTGSNVQSTLNWSTTGVVSPCVMTWEAFSGTTMANISLKTLTSNFVINGSKTDIFSRPESYDYSLTCYSGENFTGRSVTKSLTIDVRGAAGACGPLNGGFALSSGGYAADMCASGNVENHVINASWTGMTWGCAGLYGGASTSATACSATLVPARPTLTFSGGPLTIQSGNTANLTWSTTYALSCRATGTGWTPGSTSIGYPVATTWTTPPLTETKTYSLECFSGVDFKGFSTGIQTVTISVIPPTPGACGATSGTAQLGLTSSSPNLCANAPHATVLDFTALPGNGGWTWGCSGVSGGTSTASSACSATNACPVFLDTVVTGTVTPASGRAFGRSTPGTATSRYTNDSDLSHAAVQYGLLSSGQTGLVRRVAYATVGSAAGRTMNGVTTGSFSDAVCPVRIMLAGQCGSANGVESATAPSGASLCTWGAPTPVVSGTNWTWICRGNPAGVQSNATCSAPKPIFSLRAHIECEPGYSCPGGVAGSVSWAGGYSGGDVTESGIPAQLSRSITATGSGYTFSRFAGDACTSTAGSTCNMTMDANKDVIAYFQPTSQPGICGSANGTTRPGLTSGSSDLCSSGAVDNFISSGQRYEWTCAGINGSTTNASCSAQQAIDLNWTEVQP